MQETTKQRQKKTFEHYKARLTGDHTGWTRYNVIQYLCSFPSIDPDEMAASIMRDGVEVRFDDSSISAAQNAAHRRRVCKLLTALEVPA